MTPQECYNKFSIKINKNNTGANRACDKPKFVVIFNEAKNRWVDHSLKNKNSILIDRLQQIIKTDLILSPSISDEYVDFPFTDNFYEFINANCIATKGKCRRILRLREIKNQNKELLLFDKNNSPSFDWEWSTLTIQDNKVRVYKKDFDVIQLNVEYYQVIPNIDIAGYTHIDGTPSTNIDINLSEQYVDQIINRAAEEFMRNYENTNALQIAKDRTNSES